MKNVHVHFVCTGNICRSPFAAVMLETAARARVDGAAHVTATSSGIHGLRGRPAARQMRAEGVRYGVDLRDHHGTVTQADTVQTADLVLTMTENQRRHVRRLVPAARHRVFTLKEFVRLLDHDDEVVADASGAGLRTHVRHLVQRAHRARARVPAPDATEDIMDPYGASPGIYAACADEIADHVEVLVERFLAGGSTAAGGNAGKAAG